ncbi:MAG: glycosyltransferase family 39 protein [Candidatus Omnitrophica bacterium]|nr:glycosyltransferase family 39 protein [Candidatus Omnitrophota bacterium]MDD5500406.1 glycosyltransferase family 39 protein [Candidatus Omnitrophota bacterium]
MRLSPLQNITRGNLSYNESLAIACASQPLKDILFQYFDIGLFDGLKRTYFERKSETYNFMTASQRGIADTLGEVGNKTVAFRGNETDGSRHSQWTGVESSVPAVKEAQRSFMEGEYGNSIAVLNKCLTENNISEDSLRLIYAGLASNYVEQGIKNPQLRPKMYWRARVFFLRAKGLPGKENPLNISVYSGLGFLYLQEGDYKMSLQMLREGLSFDLTGFEKEKRDMCINQGIAYFHSGRKDESENSLNQALTLHPTKEEKNNIYSLLRDLYINRGFAYLNSGREEEAEKDLIKFLSLNPIKKEKKNVSSALRNLYITQGFAYFNSGDESKAEESFGKALAFSFNEKEKQDIYSSLRNLYMQQGFNCFNSGEKDGSEKLLNKALQLHPTRKEKNNIYSALRHIYITRGFNYFNSGQRNEAEENLVKVLSLDPIKKEQSDVYAALRNIYMQRGFMYLNLDNRSKVEDNFKKLLSLHPPRIERDYIKLWLRPLSFVSISPDQAPLRYIILHVFMFLGNSEFIVRLPSLIFGLAGILVVYLLGRLLFGFPTGILSSFLLVFSMWHMRYSISASDYTLYAFLSSLNVYFFYRSFIKPSSLPLRIAFVVVSVLGLYSFYPIASILLAEAVFLCIFTLGKKRNNKELISWAIAFAAITLLFSPVFDRFFHGFTWKQGFGDYHWGLSLKELFPALTSVFNGLNIAMPVNFIIFASGLFFAFCFRKKHKEALLLVLVILIPVVLLLACFFLKINLAERYLFFLYPFFVILCSYGIICLKNKFVVLFLPVIFNAALILFFLAFFGLPMDKYIPQDYFRRDADFHSLGEYLGLNYQQNDSLAVINAAGVYALKYNLDAANNFKVERVPPGSCQRLRYSGKALKNTIGLAVSCELKKDIETITEKYPRVWVVDLNMIHYSDHEGAIEKWLSREAKIKESFTGMTVYLLENKMPQDRTGK